MKINGMKTVGMTNFTDITLAMDLALTSPGFAVLAVFEGKPIVLETSVITTVSEDVIGKRLCDIEDEIARLINAYRPHHIVREKGFSRFAAATQALFRVVGISDRIAYVLGAKEVTEIPPTTVKKAVTGNGKASKEEVADAVFRILQIENTDEYYRIKRNGERELLDDKTDALAVGIAYMKQKGLIKL